MYILYRQFEERNKLSIYAKEAVEIRNNIITYTIDNVFVFK